MTNQVEASANQDKRLIKIGGELSLVFALPVAGEGERIDQREHFVFFGAPAALHKLVGGGDGPF